MGQEAAAKKAAEQEGAAKIKAAEEEPVPPSPAAVASRANGNGSSGEEPIWLAEWLQEQRVLRIEISLPGVERVSQLELDCSQEELDVSGGGYDLRLEFGTPMDDDSISAQFNATQSKL